MSRKPDEIMERYGQPKDGVCVVITKAAHNTYLHVEELRNGEWRAVVGSSRGLGDKPYNALMESVLAQEIAKRK